MNTLRNDLICAALPAMIHLLKPEVDSMGYILPTQWRPVVSGCIKIADEILREIQACESPITGSAEVDWAQAPEWAMWHAWDGD